MKGNNNKRYFNGNSKKNRGDVDELGDLETPPEKWYNQVWNDYDMF